MKTKGIHKIIISVLVCAALAISCMTVVMPYADDDITSDLASFDDKDQDQIVYDMGAGINLGNQFEAVNADGYPSETAWGNPVITKELVKQIHDSGFNTIRLPVSYFLRIGEAPDYAVEEAWLDRIQEVVDYAYELGMYVIINMHGDGYYTIDNSWLLLGNYDDINPKKFSTDEEYQAALKAEEARIDAMVDKYEKVWTQVAERYKDYDEHIIFESMNEMQSKQTGTTFAKIFYPVLNRLNQSFVDTIRKTGGNNAKRWLLIPGWWASLDKITNDSLGFEIPTDTYKDSSITENRLFLSIHFYEPSDFCLTETAATTKWSYDSGYSNIETQFKQAYEKFISQGYPVIIGEFGSVDKSAFDRENTSCREAYYNAVSKAAKQYGLVPVVWDNGYTGNYGLALFDRSKATVKYQQIINGVMEVYNPDKVIDVPTDPTVPSDPDRKELTLTDGYPFSAECPNNDDGSYNGYLQSILKDVYNFADYSELEVKFTVDGEVSDDTNVFNFQPYTNSYSGWQNTFLTIGDCTLDDDGVYTGKIALTSITDHLGLADTYGINISYAQAEPDIVLESYYIIKSDVASPTEPTTEPTTVQLGGDVESNLYFADSDWSMQANIPVTITGDGLYTYDVISQEGDTYQGDASGAVVFVIDFYNALNSHPNMKAELVSINCNGNDIEIDQNKIPAFSDIEGKGNLRLEIYNEYGLTKDDPPIDFFDIDFPMGEVMSVTIKISDFDADSEEPTTDVVTGGDIDSNLYFADSDWSMQANVPVTITGDGVYTYEIVSKDTDAYSGDAWGAVVYVIDFNNAANTHPNLQVELLSINCAGHELEIDQSKLPALADIEDNGNLRLEIYNEYGLTKDDPPIDFFDIDFLMGEVMTVTIKVSNFDEGSDVTEETPSTDNTEDSTTVEDETTAESTEAEETSAETTVEDVEQETTTSVEEATTATSGVITATDSSNEEKTTVGSDALEDKSNDSTSPTDKPVNTGAPIAVGSSVFMVVGAAGIIAIKKRRK